MLSVIPVVRRRARRRSWSLGTYSSAQILSMSSMKLFILISMTALHLDPLLGVGNALGQIVMQRIFIAFGDGLFHATVLPQSFDGLQVFLGELVLGADLVFHEYPGHVFLPEPVSNPS